MHELRIPKRREPAQVLVTGGGIRKVDLFLSQSSPHHAGPENPSDVLNGQEDFVPVFDHTEGAVAFLHRSALQVVRVARREATQEVTLPTEHEVVVHLSDGAALTGLVSYVRPPGFRLVDFLNEPEPFLRLLETDALALVNKRHIARVAFAAR